MGIHTGNQSIVKLMVPPRQRYRQEDNGKAAAEAGPDFVGVLSGFRQYVHFIAERNHDQETLWP